MGRLGGPDLDKNEDKVNSLRDDGPRKRSAVDSGKDSAVRRRRGGLQRVGFSPEPLWRWSRQEELTISIWKRSGRVNNFFQKMGTISVTRNSRRSR